MAGRPECPDRTPASHHWRLAAVTAFAAAALALAVASPVQAASVDPIPVATGPQGCATLAARFGADPGTWKEIRFTHTGGQSLPPGVLTKTAQGNTVTLTLTTEGTVSFASQQPIEAVYVNKGTYPNAGNTIYRYVPPVTADTNLGLLPIVLSGVDHVVLCWTSAAPATTTTVAATTSVSPTTAVVLDTTIVRTTVQGSVTTSAAGTATTGAARLPETGGPTGSTLLLAGVLLVSGLAALMVPLARRWP